MEEKGLIVVWLEKLFGRSWHTWIAAIVAAIPQIINGLQEGGINFGISATTLNSISIIATTVGVAMSKSQSVSGANRTESTGVPGPKETGKDPACEEGKGK